MATFTFRVTRNALLLPLDQNPINGEEFTLLYDINTSSNLDFSYWKYPPSFNLKNIYDAGCRAEFHFLTSYIYKLVEVLQTLSLIKCYTDQFSMVWNAFAYFLNDLLTHVVMETWFQDS